MFESIVNWFWSLIYGLISGICWLVQCIYEMFEVFAGLRFVKYNGSDSFLINVFFGHSSITRIYWGMAAIGIVLCFAFAVVAVTRKVFDAEDKMQTTMGALVGNMLKSIILILLMNFILMAAINASNVLLQQIDYVFTGKTEYGIPGSTIEFDDEDYATMARIYDTIGNYSLNTSYNSRFNINNCFNSIREDLLLLADKGVFEYDYKNAGGDNGTDTWQSVLVPIARSASLTEDVKIDTYNNSLMDAMLYAMEVIQSNRSFHPVESYTQPGVPLTETQTRMDAVLMMVGTMNAANNKEYNKNASLLDPLRAPYATGEKDMYDHDVVGKDFSFAKMDYMIVLITSLFIGYQFLFICVNCIGRIFNMMLLYLTAPPFIATNVMDNGSKMKQWTVAFVVQSFSVFGSVVAMRLVLVFIPIVLSDNLILFPDSSTLNFIGKIILIIGACMTANKAYGLISGILAESAGWQAITAGDVGGTMMSDLSTTVGVASGLASAAKSGVNLGKSVVSAGKSIGNYFSGKKDGDAKNNSDAGDGTDKQAAAAAAGGGAGGEAAAGGDLGGNKADQVENMRNFNLDDGGNDDAPARGSQGGSVPPSKYNDV